MSKAQFRLTTISLSLVLSSCTSTFMGSVFVFTFSDIVYYFIIALSIAFIIGMLSRENFRKYFWIWFILNILITPLPGFIFLLIKLMSKK